MTKGPKPRNETPKVDDTKSVSIYLAFNSSVPNLMINDESLRVLFGAYGPIEDVSIKQSVIDRQTQCQRGYAFVCFVPDDVGVQAAMQAATQMADCMVDGVHYRCEVSKSLKSKLDPTYIPPATTNRALSSKSSMSSGYVSQLSPHTIMEPSSISSSRVNVAHPRPMVYNSSSYSTAPRPDTLSGPGNRWYAVGVPSGSDHLLPRSSVQPPAHAMHAPQMFWPSPPQTGSFSSPTPSHDPTLISYPVIYPVNQFAIPQQHYSNPTATSPVYPSFAPPVKPSVSNNLPPSVVSVDPSSWNHNNASHARSQQAFPVSLGHPSYSGRGGSGTPGSFPPGQQQYSHGDQRYQALQEFSHHHQYN